MYVISLTYLVGLDAIDAARPAHLEWLKKHYDSGLFLVSGRKNPPTGGVIISKTVPRPILEDILNTDPFSIQKLARYEVIEFEAKMTCDELAGIA